MAVPLIQMAIDSLDFEMSIEFVDQTTPSGNNAEASTFPDELILVDLKTLSLETTPDVAVEINLDDFGDTIRIIGQFDTIDTTVTSADTDIWS